MTSIPALTPPKRLLALLVASLLVLAACGAGEAPTGERATSTPLPDTTHAERSDPDPAAGYVVAHLVASQLEVHTTPGVPDAAEPALRLDATTAFGSPRVLLVLDEVDGWVQVLVPARPNGSTGWVRASDVERVVVDHAVHVDLAAKRLEVTHRGELILETPIAIGTPEAPTPVGVHFVTDLLETPEPDGPYGPYAFGISAWSETLSEFAGGDGQVGIHGTNNPSSIGRAASSGCVRVPNDVIAELASMLPLGTPVLIA